MQTPIVISFVARDSYLLNGSNMSVINIESFQSGSHWRRWNPHLHAPGTLLNDQFAGDWEGYLNAIEKAMPAVEVLGVTDYLCIDTYKAVWNYKNAGRLKNVQFMFPNVEFRLTIETDKRKGINLHLLFSPDDPSHIERIEGALLSLAFEYQGSPYRCTPSDFERLGRAHNGLLTDNMAARREGANQFKVTLEDLRKLFRGDKWVLDNCVIGVAASSNDGTAGLQADASFSALRQEIEGFANVIFSSNAKTREFWLGKSTAADVLKLTSVYGGVKPCLHGCDAHSVAKTCKPDDNRYCWIKGDPSFETLRQALLEPEARVWIGEHAPTRHDASQCIERLSTKKTPWIKNDSIPFNNGLVAIIGSRGSGKTALADILAIGSNVTSPLDLPTSFIHRASNPVNYLNEAEIHTFWGDGTSVPRWMNLRLRDAGEESVRYLSQQFVEQLCSAEGLAIELRKEIERVVFDATEPADRCDAGSFEELAEVYLKPVRRNREVAQESIENTSGQVNAEELLHARIPTIEREQKERLARIAKFKGEMATLIPTDKEEHAKTLARLEAALLKMNLEVEKLNRSKLRVQDLYREVDNTRKKIAPQELNTLMISFSETGLSAEDWIGFEMVFKGDVDSILNERAATIGKHIQSILNGDGTAPDLSTVPYEKWPMNILRTARDKAKEQVGLDARKQQRYNQLQQQVAADEKQQEKSVLELADAKGAEARRVNLVERRRELYVEVFQSFLDEKQILEDLYAPLQLTLKDATGSLKRLRLSVSRDIDVSKWINAGEQLLDLRKESELRGHGALQKHVEKLLLPAWQAGTAEDVGAAMQEFIRTTYPEVLKAMPTTITPSKRPAWIQQVATWFYSTEHIEMQYSITYDGVAIEQLSPGTRGIVLLLLYLVIDAQDRRPLIIDQPEENLDPKSVFEELVPHFREARKRRQVIIVTHNANLVVNTDADQVIVAASETNVDGGLPNVTYRCGAIENPSIRKAVCEILEGGEQAFLDRERRYRLQRKIEVEE